MKTENSTVRIRIETAQGKVYDSPSAKQVSGLLALTPGIWAGGTGMGLVQRFDAAQHLEGEVMLLGRESRGTLILYCPANSEDQFISVSLSPTNNVFDHVFPGGNRWDVPGRYFMSRDYVTEFVEHFIQTGRQLDTNYIVFGEDEELIVG